MKRKILKTKNNNQVMIPINESNTFDENGICLTEKLNSFNERMQIIKDTINEILSR